MTAIGATWLGFGSCSEEFPPVLHELERGAMEVVWSEGAETVREVLKLLNARGEKQRAYTTVLTILIRLDTKGMLTRRREKKTDFYSPTMTRDEYLETRAGAEVGALVDEFGDLALVHFARQMGQLDPKRRDQLRRLARRA